MSERSLTSICTCAASWVTFTDCTACRGTVVTWHAPWDHLGRLWAGRAGCSPGTAAPQGSGLCHLHPAWKRSRAQRPSGSGGLGSPARPPAPTTCRSYRARGGSTPSQSLSPPPGLLPGDTDTFSAAQPPPARPQPLPLQGAVATHLLNEEPRVACTPKQGRLLQSMLKQGLEGRAQGPSHEVRDPLCHRVIPRDGVLWGNRSEKAGLRRGPLLGQGTLRGLPSLTSLLRSSRTSTNLAGNQPVGRVQVTRGPFPGGPGEHPISFGSPRGPCGPLTSQAVQLPDPAVLVLLRNDLQEGDQSPFPWGQGLTPPTLTLDPTCWGRGRVARAGGAPWCPPHRTAP